MKPLYVEAVGLIAPGLAGWSEALSVLRGEAPYIASELSPYAPQLLPPNERRRATASVRLAFRAAEDAMSRSAFSPSALAAVFATSEADTQVMHRICSGLAEPQPLVSPTDFHNSVHNAAAGYWSIAAACREPSISISGWDGSFALGLLESATLAHGDGSDVLLVAYDIVPPSPLSGVRPISAAVGTALVLTPQRSERSLAQLSLSLTADAGTEMQDSPLEALRRSNPAGRALPLLALLAQGLAGAVVLPCSGDALRIEVGLL